MEHQNTRNKKRVLDVGYYLQWWEQQIGVYLLADLSKTLILEQREKLIKTGINVEQRAPATVNRYMGVLSHALSVAVNEWEWAARPPDEKYRKTP